MSGCWSLCGCGAIAAPAQLGCAGWLLAAGFSFEISLPALVGRRLKERTVSRSAAVRCNPTSVLGVRSHLARKKLPIPKETGSKSRAADTALHCDARCGSEIHHIHAALPGCSAVFIAPVVPEQTHEGSKHSRAPPDWPHRIHSKKRVLKWRLTSDWVKDSPGVICPGSPLNPDSRTPLAAGALALLPWPPALSVGQRADLPHCSTIGFHLHYNTQKGQNTISPPWQPSSATFLSMRLRRRWPTMKPSAPS